MEIIDTIFLNAVCITTPLSLYLLYSVYEKTFNKKENNLLILVTMSSMVYMMLKLDRPLTPNIPLLWINIPLIIAYYKKSNMSSLIASLLIIFYYNSFYQKYLIIIILEYIIYYIVFMKLNKSFKANTIIFCFIKFTFTLFLMHNYTLNNILNLVLEIILVLIAVIMTKTILEKTEDTLKLHMTLKEIKHDKQIKSSLFQITHEIKNPIAVCKGYLDMFDVENKKHAKKYIPIIKEEIDRTLILLEDFLSMNKLKINKEIIDINLLIEDVIKKIKLMCIENNITIETYLLDDEIYIYGDYNRLTQVFINIIKNSIEALKTNNKKIKIWVVLENDNIIINIKDNGKGMNEDVLEKIKEPFYTTKARGTGLGVSLSNEIVLAHNGKLEYESQEDKYTKVTVTLPLET